MERNERIAEALGFCWWAKEWAGSVPVAALFPGNKPPDFNLPWVKLGEVTSTGAASNSCNDWRFDHDVG